MAGTPIFFVDGELPKPQSVTNLKEAFDAALRD